MNRRSLILASGALIPTAALAQGQLPPARPANSDAPPVQGAPETQGPPPPSPRPDYPSKPGGNPHAETYSREELVNSVSDFLGVTAEAAGAAIERIFRENGHPTGYVAGEELAAAITIGVRYGKGLLYMKNREAQQVFWQGPSIGFDLRANGSRVFTLCYDLQYPEAIFQRFPGVEGSAYFIGGLGVNYQRSEDIVLAPIRAGVGLGAGINIGYLSYSRRRHWLPV